MSFPFSTTKKVAYQTFRPSEQALGKHGTSSSPLRVVVDGFTAEVECRKLESHTVDISFQGSGLGNGLSNRASRYKTDLGLLFEGCGNVTTPLQIYVDWQAADSIENATDQTGCYWAVRPNFTTAMTGCSSLPQSQSQFLYLAGYFTASPQNASIPKLDNVAAVICAAKPQVVKVEVVDDGITTTS